MQFARNFGAKAMRAGLLVVRSTRAHLAIVTATVAILAFTVPADAAKTALNVPSDNTVTTAKIVPEGVWGSDIHKNTIGEDRLGQVVRQKLNKAAPASPFADAYYAVAFYDKGDTNAGAIATVACKKDTDTAISGGVQVINPTLNTPVSSSFPGRMDWTTNTPKPGRLDGWVVQFGGNAGAVSDKDPLKVKIFALCVPALTLPVTTTYTQSEG